MRRTRSDGATAAAIPDEVRGLFDGRCKVARYFAAGVDDELELYDLREDPLELRNLARDPAYAALTRAMADRLRHAEGTEMAPIDPNCGVTDPNAHDAAVAPSATLRRPRSDSA